MAILSTADELYFGGAAGGGKTQLGMGLSLTMHRNTLFLRRQQTDCKAIAETYRSLPKTTGGWKNSGYGGEFRTGDGRLIEVNGCQGEGDWQKYAGHAHDLKLYDELPQFSKKQFTTLNAWNRVRDPLRFPHQRCRAIGMGNPPTTPEGEWVLEYWMPWFESTAGEMAKPGELRWYVRVDGDDKEQAVGDGTPITHRGRIYQPRSRTFIPSRVEDNPAYMEQGYDAVLNSLPEPLRSQLRYGDMAAKHDDPRWQLIPTSWVVAAQKRWQARGGLTQPFELSQVGVDVAMEGADQTVVCRRFGPVIPPLIRRPGKKTPDGQSVVDLILEAGGGFGVKTCVDAIGIGKSAYDVGREKGMELVAVVASAGTKYKDPKVRKLTFLNTRAAMMWNVRVLLDPEGDPATRLCLPPDRELMVDLCAPRYKLSTGGIQVEKKDEIRERIGRSTDSGDAVALACWNVEPIVVFS